MRLSLHSYEHAQDAELRGIQRGLLAGRLDK
jgi:hypothetical protein